MRKTKWILLSLIMALILLVPSNTFAATRNKWVKKGEVYTYYKADGKLAKNGIFKIGNKSFCFNKDGRQLTGWREVGSHTYYFKHGSGSSGYMVTNKKIDGIQLGKNGRANPGTKRAKAKLPLLVSSRKMVDKIVGRGAKSEKKLKSCYNYLIKHYNIYFGFSNNVSSNTWDIAYAKQLLDYKAGDCYGFATTFAYLAHALGYEDATIVANGHCWVRIGSNYYDPFWAKQYKIDAFNVPPKKCNRNNMFHTDWHRDWTYSMACRK